MEETQDLNKGMKWKTIIKLVKEEAVNWWNITEICAKDDEGEAQ